MIRNKLVLKNWVKLKKSGKTWVERRLWLKKCSPGNCELGQSFLLLGKATRSPPSPSTTVRCLCHRRLRHCSEHYAFANKGVHSFEFFKCHFVSLRAKNTHLSFFLCIKSRDFFIKCFYYYGLRVQDVPPSLSWLRFTHSFLFVRETPTLFAASGDLQIITNNYFDPYKITEKNDKDDWKTSFFLNSWTTNKMQ